ncbi:MAG: hypothetical protein IIZ25_09520 [Thermoguttaceae bacterium]|nr:hypothetical protein [Thermoguttaceae bacterium]
MKSSPISPARRYMFGLPLLLTALFCFCAAAALLAETRYGAKVIKETFGETPAPELTVPDGWTLLSEERFTGVNIREYFFTIKNDADNAEPPMVEVRWPAVAIDQVVGGQRVEKTDDGVRFLCTSARTPTQFVTTLPPLGAVHVQICHNIPGMQAGPYRDHPFPKNEVAAHLNYIFASREMMRLAGFTESADSFDGQIYIHGFETNFPNGHQDFPPHFHITTVWDGWKWIQATHFILSKEGKVLQNDHYVVENNVVNKERSITLRPDVPVEMTDRNGTVKFIFRVLPDGSGIAMTCPGSDREYRLKSGDATRSVSLDTRADGSSPWETVSTSSAVDDPIAGVLTVKTERGGETITEVWRYNPITGDVLK